MQLDFKLTGDKTVDRDLESADDVALRYRTLLGDIIFLAGDCDFSTHWGWVPIVDFVASMKSTTEELRCSPSVACAFEFTESNARIEFARTPNSILVRSNYSPCKAEVPLHHFLDAVTTFIQTSFEKLTAERPELLNNRRFRELLGNGQEGDQSNY